MQRLLLIFYVHFWVTISIGQTPLNQWYSFGREQSVFNSIHATDSCYYCTGMVINEFMPNRWDFVFSKLDLDGNIQNATYFHSDTNDINCLFSNLLKTLDDNFATLVDYDESFLFMKIDPDGDTVLSTLIDHFFINENFQSIRPSHILQNESDSSFICIGLINHTLSLESRIAIIKLSSTGEILTENSIGINEPGYIYTNPRDLVKVSDGYIISSDITKTGGSIAEVRSRVRFVKIDYDGNEQWSWIDWSQPLSAYPHGLTLTSDGGYLFGGLSGSYNVNTNSQNYVSRVTKLKADFTLDWEFSFGDSTDENYINIFDIEEISAEKFVAIGYCLVDSMVIGTQVCFNNNGQKIWDSYFSFVQSSSSALIPWHELYDIECTPDGGFAIVGVAQDWEEINSGNAGSFAWLVKTDSVGCLVPDCQDFLSLENRIRPSVNIKTYPNPTSNFLYIYYSDKEFSSNDEILIYDMHGAIVQRWHLISGDITYIYDTSELVSGTYILNVINSTSVSFESKFIVQH